MIAGGKVDVLLGIQYLSIYPVIVRQLDCGLTIFKSRLVSHDRKMIAMIGVPHSNSWQAKLATQLHFSLTSQKA